MTSDFGELIELPYKYGPGEETYEADVKCVMFASVQNKRLDGDISPHEHQAIAREIRGSALPTNEAALRLMAYQAKLIHDAAVSFGSIKLIFRAYPSRKFHPDSLQTILNITESALKKLGEQNE